MVTCDVSRTSPKRPRPRCLRGLKSPAPRGGGGAFVGAAGLLAPRDDPALDDGAGLRENGDVTPPPPPNQLPRFSTAFARATSPLT